MELSKSSRVVELCSGWPKVGKTGSLVPLLEAGWRILYCNFDHNEQPLAVYASSEALKRLVNLPFADKMVAKGSKDILSAMYAQPDSPKRPVLTTPAGLRQSLKDLGAMELDGDPTAFLSWLQFLDTGRYVRGDGTVEDYGPDSSWGPDTILVTDSLTAVCDASERLYYYTSGIPKTAKRRKDWGNEQGEIGDALQRVTAAGKRYHVIMTAHLKMQGPEDLEDPTREKSAEDREYSNNLKKARAEIQDTKFYPRTPGRMLPPAVAGHFPIHVLAEVAEVNGAVGRYIHWQPTLEMDLALPVPPGFKMPKDLPIETGQLTIFKAITGKDHP